MNSSWRDVQNVLRALIPLINECKEELRSQHVANALYGLQHMNSNVDEVRGVLRALTTKIKDCRQHFIGQAVSNSLIGLKNMSSDFKEVQGVLRELATKIKDCTQMSAQEVGNSLYGLQNMSSDVKEVRSILRELVPKIRECKELSPQSIGNALYGLQNMNSDAEEVNAVIRELFPKIQKFKDIMIVQSISNALFGLRSIKIDASSKDLLAALLKQLFLQVNEASSFDDLIVSYQTVAILLNPSCKFALSMRELSLFDYITEQSKRLYTLLYKHPHKAFKDTSENRTTSRVEDMFAKRLQEKLGNIPNIQISNNEYLKGFEADIVIRKRSVVDTEVVTVLNIELDGPSHKYDLTKKHFCVLRDEHLNRQHGIIIKRFETSEVMHEKLEGIIDEVKYIIESI